MTHKFSRSTLRLFALFTGVAVICLATATPSPAQDLVAEDKIEARQIKELPIIVCAPVSLLLSVKEIDAAALAKLLPQTATKSTRPMLVNFWATWCVPCREEFPDLVKIDDEFRKRGLDFFTVSLDDPAEIATTVPEFLREMKAERIPAYLLNTPEPADAINAVDKTWSGALPATFLFNRQGQIVYKHTGRINPAELKAAIEKVISDK